MSTRRVTFVLPLLLRHPVGGYRVVFEYANYLARHGCAVTIVVPRLVERSRSAWVFLKGLAYPWKARLLYRPLFPWFGFAPGVTLKNVGNWSTDAVPDGDAVIATAWTTAAPVAALPARKGAKLYLVQHHETWWGGEAVDRTFALPLQVVAISRWLIDIVRARGATGAVHIPNGIDHARFRRTGVARRADTVLTLYHTDAFKGVPDALAALAQAKRARPALRAVMFGVPDRGPEVPDWIEYVQDPAPETLVRLYNEASVYLSASITEGWSLPPAEAMACGCLFVGTDSGGCRDYAEPDVTALLSPPGEPAALCANLLRALDGGAEVDAIRERGHQAIGQFTWERSGAALLALIDARRA